MRNGRFSEEQMVGILREANVSRWPRSPRREQTIYSCRPRQFQPLIHGWDLLVDGCEETLELDDVFEPEYCRAVVPASRLNCNIFVHSSDVGILHDKPVFSTN